MKYWKIFLFCLLICSHSVTAQDKIATVPAIIPLPVSIRQTSEEFKLDSSTVIVFKNQELKPAAGLLQEYLPVTTLSLKTPATNYVSLAIVGGKSQPPGSYRLLVEGKKVELTAPAVEGILYGIQTLRQLILSKENGGLSLRGCEISDYPRFGYRGMALDVSRHFFSPRFVKKYIDLLALYKLNTFHWHLTDDQGWRIEIKKYPQLQSVSAWRDETMIGHKKELPHQFDGKKYGGFYTQEEIRDVLSYAKARNITVIPEIEMPGHALAALAAFPNLGCTGGPYKTATFWGIFDDVFCAGNDSVFHFLQAVLDEVIELFPSKYIHIGGDECVKTKWKACPKCQQRIRENGLTDEHALQSYFIQRIEKYVNSKGRQIIGWDEILEGGLAPNATVMSWRGEEGGIAAAKQKHMVIMTPESHLYFDYYQSLSPKEPLASGGYNPLSKVYSYEPAGESTDASVKPFILGVEGQAWSEYYYDDAQASYMLFPRVLALAELAWTPAAQRNYPNFLQRLRSQQQLLTKLGVHAADNFDEINYSSTVKGRGRLEIVLRSSYPSGRMHFTTDGSVPTTRSPLYTRPINLDQTSVVRAIMFDKEGNATGNTFERKFDLNKAAGARITLSNEPVARFNPGPLVLFNGVKGSNRYNDGQWLGFSGDNFEAVIDLGASQTISQININFLRYHWQRMWEPVRLDIFISADAVQYQKKYTQSNFPVNGINPVSANFPAANARFIKVVALNKGIIPPGEYGEGNKALLLVDEIRIE